MLVGVNVTPGDFYSLLLLYYIRILVLYNIDMLYIMFHFGFDMFGVALVRFVLGCGSFRRYAEKLAGCVDIWVRYQIRIY